MHTYSIVARDAETGEMAVGVQSHWFNVGPIVAWAEAGVGAVATQSFVEVSFGPRGLELMAAGRAPAQALQELLRTDPGRAVRQVALLDADGNVAVHTGDRCIAHAGHESGEGFSVQANLMESERVVPAMAEAFRSSEGPLAERVLGTLEAAERAGGDVRGRQSAALLVVAREASGDPARDVIVDLRVDDHPRPLEELRRLYTLHRAYRHMNAGDAALERGDHEAALREYGAASELAPQSLEIRFWSAFALATNERLEEALPILREVFEGDARWREVLRRLPAAGLMDEETAAEILERA